MSKMDFLKGKQQLETESREEVEKEEVNTQEDVTLEELSNISVEVSSPPPAPALERVSSPSSSLPDSLSREGEAPTSVRTSSPPATGSKARRFRKRWKYRRIQR